MNTLSWIVATIASVAMAFLFFTEYAGATLDILGFVCIGLSFFCVAMTIDALLDDIRTGGGLK